MSIVLKIAFRCMWDYISPREVSMGSVDGVDGTSVPAPCGKGTSRLEVATDDMTCADQYNMPLKPRDALLCLRRNEKQALISNTLLYFKRNNSMGWFNSSNFLLRKIS